MHGIPHRKINTETYKGRTIGLAFDDFEISRWANNELNYINCVYYSGRDKLYNFILMIAKLIGRKTLDGRIVIKHGLQNGELCDLLQIKLPTLSTAKGKIEGISFKRFEAVISEDILKNTKVNGKDTHTQINSAAGH